MQSTDRTGGEVDFQRQPYRGIISEVARELGVSQPSISARMKRRDPVVLTLVLAKIKERERTVERFDAKISGDAA